MKTRIQQAVALFTDDQLRLMCDITNKPEMIASLLSEAYQELSDRDNHNPGTFSGGDRGVLESSLQGCDASAWISNR